MGEILNGRFRHGKGILLWENGDRFEGYFDHNKRVGKGKEIFIKELPSNMKYIKYGIYRVKIESDDENFKKVFK